MRTRSLAVLVLGLIVLGGAYAEGYGEGVWLDENAPGAGAPSIVPLLVLGVAGLALVVCGLTWLVLALSDTSYRSLPTRDDAAA